MCRKYYKLLWKKAKTAIVNNSTNIKMAIYYSNIQWGCEWGIFIVYLYCCFFLLYDVNYFSLFYFVCSFLPSIVSAFPSDILVLLLHSRYNDITKTYIDTTPLEIAVWRKKMKIVQLLIKEENKLQKYQGNNIKMAIFYSNRQWRCEWGIFIVYLYCCFFLLYDVNYFSLFLLLFVLSFPQLFSHFLLLSPSCTLFLLFLPVLLWELFLPSLLVFFGTLMASFSSSCFSV
jgi:hypothetical protein